MQTPGMLPSQDPYAATAMVPSQIKPRKLWLVPTVILLLIVLFAGGAFAYAQFVKSPSPDQVFKSALLQALSTQSVIQQSGQSGATAITKYDLTNVKDPRVDTSVAISDGSAKNSFEGYGSLKNSYVKIHSFIGMDTIPVSLRDKWIQISKNGVIPTGVSTSNTFYNLYDPNQAVLGQYIFGNFSANDRNVLVNYALTQHLYQYDAQQVKKSTIDGASVYAYQVSIDQKKLEAFNIKAAKLFGISSAKLNTSLGALSTTKATMYVTTKNSRLIKVVLTDGPTTTYTAWNSTKLPSEPVPVFPYEQYGQLLESAAASPGQTIQTVSQEAADAERKTDIESLDSRLEAYYAQNGYYPTLDNLNDPSWIAANFIGLDPAALKDPEGSSNVLSSIPSPKQYAYEYGVDSSLASCTDDLSLCGYFKLSATLSDGSLFTEGSL